MVNLYDEEIVAAYRVGESLNARFSRKTWTSMKQFEAIADELEKEAAEAFAGIGLIVSVDATPMLARKPPLVSVVARAPGNEFDHERKAEEVRLARERGEAVLGESG